MKRALPLLLVLCLILCACGKKPEATEPSTVATTAPTEATTVPTTEPTAPTTEPPVLYWNPLTGEALDEPHEGRIFTCTVSNVPDALPMHGVNDSDLFFEMLVNGGATRGLAMFADVTTAGNIGSMRSARFNFVDICEAYDAILAYSGASDDVYGKIYNCGIDHMNDNGTYFFRDESRWYSGYEWEHCLFTSGENLLAYAQDWEYRTTAEAGKQYGLEFSKDVALNGEDAGSISFNFWSNSRGMVYDEQTGRYNYWLYGAESTEGNTGDPTSFKNVLLLQMDVYYEGQYHVADIDGNGEGYFACNGKIVPIQWHHENEYEPFTFTLMDGTPLKLGIGNSYIGFVPVEDEISWE